MIDVHRWKALYLIISLKYVKSVKHVLIQCLQNHNVLAGTASHYIVLYRTAFLMQHTAESAGTHRHALLATYKLCDLLDCCRIPKAPNNLHSYR